MRCIVIGSFGIWRRVHGQNSRAKSSAGTTCADGGVEIDLAQQEQNANTIHKCMKRRVLKRTVHT